MSPKLDEYGNITYPSQDTFDEWMRNQGGATNLNYSAMLGPNAAPGTPDLMVNDQWVNGQWRKTPQSPASPLGGLDTGTPNQSLVDKWSSTFLRDPPPAPTWNRGWNQPYSDYGHAYGGTPVGKGGSNTAGLPEVFAPFTPTPVTTAPPYAGQLNPAIQSLITPGLVPDIARQSAEVSAGRGIRGSPAGGSTAVRMSEQNWLQRLGLANTLMGGEAGRQLPYDITPSQGTAFDIQQRELALRRYIAELEAQTQQDISRRSSQRLSSGGGVGGGGGFQQPYYPFMGGSQTSPYETGWGGGGRPELGNESWGGGGDVFGGGGGGDWSLDEIYSSLGIGDFEDSGGGDFYDEMWD